MQRDKAPKLVSVSRTADSFVLLLFVKRRTLSMSKCPWEGGGKCPKGRWALPREGFHQDDSHGKVSTRERG